MSEVQHGVGTGRPWVAGFCPACGKRGLFVGEGGYVTCSQIGCPNPGAPSDVLFAPAPDPTVTVSAADRVDLTLPLRDRLTEQERDDLLAAVRFYPYRGPRWDRTIRRLAALDRADTGPTT
ncbi:hypothetical protein GCM10027047_01470 [Rhodococcus aerolatus]